MTLDYSKHKNILLQILKDIYSDTSIATYLGFKGGTAAMMFYDLPRNSVDIDLDLLDETKEKEVFEKINKIVANYGKITDSYMQRFNLRNVISYDAKAQNIKVEVNRRQFGSKYEMKTFLGISMLVMVQEDMFAHKLMAMLERIGKTSRDIFDVQYFAKNNWPINRKIVEERSGVSFKEALTKSIEMLEKMDNKHILDGLGELLADSQKDSARAKLKSDTIFQLNIMVTNTTKADLMPPYLNHEVTKIKEIINSKYFAGTFFACVDLKINKNNKAFFEKNTDSDFSFGYEVDCEITQDGKKQDVFVSPINRKIDETMVAHHIAHEVWSRFDKTTNSQLWKNFGHKTT